MFRTESKNIMQMSSMVPKVYLILGHTGNTVLLQKPKDPTGEYGLPGHKGGSSPGTDVQTMISSGCKSFGIHELHSRKKAIMIATSILSHYHQ